MNPESYLQLVARSKLEKLQVPAALHASCDGQTLKLPCSPTLRPAMAAFPSRLPTTGMTSLMMLRRNFPGLSSAQFWRAGPKTSRQPCRNTRQSGKPGQRLGAPRRSSSQRERAIAESWSSSWKQGRRWTRQTTPVRRRSSWPPSWDGATSSSSSSRPKTPRHVPTQAVGVSTQQRVDALTAMAAPTPQLGFRCRDDVNSPPASSSRSAGAAAGCWRPRRAVARRR